VPDRVGLESVGAGWAAILVSIAAVAGHPTSVILATWWLWVGSPPSPATADPASIASAPALGHLKWDLGDHDGGRRAARRLLPLRAG
jgi:hypothetical protein